MVKGVVMWFGADKGGMDLVEKEKGPKRPLK